MKNNYEVGAFGQHATNTCPVVKSMEALNLEVKQQEASKTRSEVAKATASFGAFGQHPEK